MRKTICGLDCEQCDLHETCAGCSETGGRPLGGACVVATCCQDGTCEQHGKFFDVECPLKKQLIAEFNALGIEDMGEINGLNALPGRYINLEYNLSSGQTVKLLDDKKIYLGNQICKKGSDRCYGLAADEHMLLVCEYGDNGTQAELVVYKRRRVSD